MQSDLGFSDAAYGVGAGIFFLGYVLFEMPSNLMLPKIGARRTFSRILVLWGITSACMLFVRNVPAFYAMRFLLGVFEAGFAPGMIYYLSCWYGPARMARAIALVFVAGPLGGIVGGPFSAWLITTLSGVGGLAGWQWMFLVEGLPCIALGVLTLRVLSDRPADARWLTDDEKLLLDRDTAPSQHRADSFKAVLKKPARLCARDRVLLHHLSDLRDQLLAADAAQGAGRERHDPARLVRRDSLCRGRDRHVPRRPPLRPRRRTALSLRDSGARRRGAA